MIKIRDTIIQLLVRMGMESAGSRPGRLDATSTYALLRNCVIMSVAGAATLFLEGLSRYLLGGQFGTLGTIILTALIGGAIDFLRRLRSDYKARADEICKPEEGQEKP